MGLPPVTGLQIVVAVRIASATPDSWRLPMGRLRTRWQALGRSFGVQPLRVRWLLYPRGPWGQGSRCRRYCCRACRERLDYTSVYEAQMSCGAHQAVISGHRPSFRRRPTVASLQVDRMAAASSLRRASAWGSVAARRASSSISCCRARLSNSSRTGRVSSQLGSMPTGICASWPVA